MTENARAALAAVAELTKPRGPTAPLVADRLGTTRVAALRMLNRLARDGFVQKVAHGAGQGAGRGGSHVYYSLTLRGFSALDEEAS